MSPRTASSPVSWALLSSGVTDARINLHRLKILLDRATGIVQESDHKDEIYQIAGDIVEGVPGRLAEIERALDRTAYALSVMGQDFLRGRLSLDDRTLVDDGVVTPDLDVRESASRVASLWSARVAAKPPTGEKYFFDAPRRREVHEFAQSGAFSNNKSVAVNSVDQADNSVRTVKQETKAVNNTPYTPSEVVGKPGGTEFGTLNRYVVKTEEKVRGMPKGYDDMPKQKPVK